MSKIIGIDMGTTNSCVAVMEGGEAVVVAAVAGNDLETMAGVLGTIPYEIMTSVSGRVKRIYLKE